MNLKWLHVAHSIDVMILVPGGIVEVAAAPCRRKATVPQRGYAKRGSKKIAFLSDLSITFG